jgi:hypothetical protein
VSDAVNNITRFLRIIQLLKLDYSVIEAATISSHIASLLSYRTINLVVKYMHYLVTKNKKKAIDSKLKYRLKIDLSRGIRFFPE